LNKGIFEYLNDRHAANSRSRAGTRHSPNKINHIVTPNQTHEMKAKASKPILKQAIAVVGIINAFVLMIAFFSILYSAFLAQKMDIILLFTVCFILNEVFKKCLQSK
jgi:hypothetical protein